MLGIFFIEMESSSKLIKKFHSHFSSSKDKQLLLRLQFYQKLTASLKLNLTASKWTDSTISFHWNRRTGKSHEPETIILN